MLKYEIKRSLFSFISSSKIFSIKCGYLLATVVTLHVLDVKKRIYKGNENLWETVKRMFKNFTQN